MVKGTWPRPAHGRPTPPCTIRRHGHRRGFPGTLRLAPLPRRRLSACRMCSAHAQPRQDCCLGRWARSARSVAAMDRATVTTKGPPPLRRTWRHGTHASAGRCALGGARSRVFPHGMRHGQAAKPRLLAEPPRVPHGWPSTSPDMYRTLMHTTLRDSIARPRAGAPAVRGSEGC